MNRSGMCKGVRHRALVIVISLSLFLLFVCLILRGWWLIECYSTPQPPPEKNAGYLQHPPPKHRRVVVTRSIAWLSVCA